MRMPPRCPADTSHMTDAPTAPSPLDTPSPPWRPRRRTRWLLWGALVALLLVAQSALVRLTRSHEATRTQDQAEASAASAANELRRLMLRAQQSAQSLMWNEPPLPQWRESAATLLRQHRGMLRLERRDERLNLLAAVDATWSGPPLFGHIARPSLEIELLSACAHALRTLAPAYSRSYFVPQADGVGVEVLDVCIPLAPASASGGVLVLTLGLGTLLEEASRSTDAQHHEFSLIEADGTRLVRAGSVRGSGVYQGTRLVDVPGNPLLLRADSIQGHPGWIPNLATALVLGLSLGLLGLVGVLAWDMRRRSQAEQALAEALALRRAMEDSLVTGLRARDVRGRVTYVNPAFCQMVGWPASSLIGSDAPPYWPPEHADNYRQRQAERLTLPPADSPSPQRQGFETVFVRHNGERFPVMIYEAPMFDRLGRHAGWMSAILDVSAERRMEELSRQQQERLQATARLATVGEMASLLSHELNQPLAAMASYAAGSLNLLADAPHDPDLPPLLRQALERIAEQAERAGRIIKSVHGFVRRREHAREVLAVDQLIEAVLPLVRLQARKSGTRVEVEMARPIPRVVADRTMVEQVLLNLTRNGIQAMERDTPLAARVLRLRVTPDAAARRVCFEVIDAGHGIAAEVAAQLFTPFFTTKTEGMGLGLSLCRTVVEQHGGSLDFGPAETSGATPCPGTVFRFTLAAPEPIRRPAPASP
jgi:two-component system, LuxR family, sensor histidine kinase DctS